MYQSAQKFSSISHQLYLHQTLHCGAMSVILLNKWFYTNHSQCSQIMIYESKNNNYLVNDDEIKQTWEVYDCKLLSKDTSTRH